MPLHSCVRGRNSKRQPENWKLFTRGMILGMCIKAEEEVGGWRLVASGWRIGQEREG